ncbi:Shedu anti-phage system protein SduA domain-containing protein [Chitinophaga agri]|uniref:DUF4263 domain-containing protein n=1 Tax=Chitinophaga agri TaxID=2703787 RepID=A0A6B9ZJQ3_9BACT|nr:Shedu anti-phage system protein SduA domain-containing protein [Chitinophaga agri]QHS60843.1 DUF4263 domain-containing protein [Chitinophaga agri]
MSLFDRSYFSITNEEKKEWTDLVAEEKLKKIGLYRSYPKAVRHYLSLFPGNLLDAVDLIDKEAELNKKIQDFKDFISQNTIGERDILNFIKSNESYFIIGSLVKKGYLFGHHSLFIFPEFQLGTNYKADYLLVGKSSDGYHFIFIELEDIKGAISTTGGELGVVMRKGLLQIEKWDEWLEANFAHLLPIFEKAKGPNHEHMPREFVVFDKSRIHFALIGGRRTDFDVIRRLQRKQRERKISIFHYDNLVDNATAAVGSLTY